MLTDAQKEALLGTGVVEGVLQESINVLDSTIGSLNELLASNKLEGDEETLSDIRAERDFYTKHREYLTSDEMNVIVETNLVLAFETTFEDSDYDFVIQTLRTSVGLTKVFGAVEATLGELIQGMLSERDEDAAEQVVIH